MAPNHSRQFLAEHFGRSVGSIHAAIHEYAIVGRGRNGQRPRPRMHPEMTTDRIERALYLMETVNHLRHYGGKHERTRSN